MNYLCIYIYISIYLYISIECKGERCSAVRKEKLFCSIKLVCKILALIIFSIKKFERLSVRIKLLRVRLLFITCSNEMWVRPVQWSFTSDKPWWLQQTLFSQFTTKLYTVFSPISGHRWCKKKLSANWRCPSFGKFFNIGLNFENKAFFYIYKV